MPKKEKLIRIEVQSAAPEGSDTPTVTVFEYTSTEWALVNAYFEQNMNQTRAYLSVHPETKYDSARVEASKFFANPNIKAEILRRLKEQAMSVEEALARVSGIARASVTPFLKKGPDGFMYFDLSHEDAKEHMWLIKEMETKRERRIEGTGEDAETWEGEWVRVKLHDAYAAQRDLLKLHGKLIDKMELTGKDGQPLQPKVDHEGFDRSLTSFADAIREIISAKNTKQDG